MRIEAGSPHMIAHRTPWNRSWPPEWVNVCQSPFEAKLNPNLSDERRHLDHGCGVPARKLPQAFLPGGWNH